MSVFNIEQTTLESPYYRRVALTSPQLQLVFMSLKPGIEIGEEIHKNSTQFIRVEAGQGIAVIDGQETRLRNGVAVFIPAGTLHNIINDGKDPLKLYTLYAPPVHRDDLIEEEKED